MKLQSAQSYICSDSHAEIACKSNKALIWLMGDPVRGGQANPEDLHGVSRRAWKDGKDGKDGKRKKESRRPKALRAADIKTVIFGTPKSKSQRTTGPRERGSGEFAFRLRCIAGGRGMEKSRDRRLNFGAGAGPKEPEHLTLPGADAPGAGRSSGAA